MGVEEVSALLPFKELDLGEHDYLIGSYLQCLLDELSRQRERRVCDDVIELFGIMVS